MKRTKFTQQQIVFAFRQAGTGNLLDEVCRKIGISEASFYIAFSRYFEGYGSDLIPPIGKSHRKSFYDTAQMKLI